MIHKPKMGRNDICNCGSGKKYKKCCLSAFEDAKQITNKYEPTELMELSMEHLQKHFPHLTFINVTDILNSKSYQTLQMKHMKDDVCQVAERIQKNERVFKERDPHGNNYDLILMYRGAYRILYGGNNIQQYTMSLSSFFTCPTKPSLQIINEETDSEQDNAQDKECDVNTRTAIYCSEDDEVY